MIEKFILTRMSIAGSSLTVLISYLALLFSDTRSSHWFGFWACVMTLMLISASTLFTTLADVREEESKTPAKFNVWQRCRSAIATLVLLPLVLHTLQIAERVA
jgi:hypothetical protein